MKYFDLIAFAGLNEMELNSKVVPESHVRSIAKLITGMESNREIRNMSTALVR